MCFDTIEINQAFIIYFPKAYGKYPKRWRTTPQAWRVKIFNRGTFWNFKNNRIEQHNSWILHIRSYSALFLYDFREFSGTKILFYLIILEQVVEIVLEL